MEFYQDFEIAREQLQYVIIVSRFRGKWLFVREEGKLTWELPAGHLETDETIYEGAFRELYEETGMIGCELISIARYSVIENGQSGYGHLFFAEIHELGELPQSEIAEYQLFTAIPKELTYPLIQPHFIKRVREFLTGHTMSDEQVNF